MTTDAERARAAELARRRRARRRNGKVGAHDHVAPYASRMIVQAALDAGMTYAQIADAAGLHDARSVRRIMDPAREYVQARTAARIRAALPVVQALHRLGAVSPKRVPVGPYRTMLRRLGAAGWSMRHLRERYGIPENAVRDRATYLTPFQAQMVLLAWDEIGGRLGPDLATARAWRSKGYLVPAAESENDQLALPRTVRAQRRHAATRARKNARRRERRAQRASVA